MDNQVPSADEQIMTRLQNAARGVLLELDSQGTAMDSVSGAYSVVIIDGVISVAGPSPKQVNKPPVDVSTTDKG